MSRVLPILFNTEMVQAILNDKKTCTRRIVKKIPPETHSVDGEYDNGELKFYANWGGYMPDIATFVDGTVQLKIPYQPGDILYVRETWHEYAKRVGKGEDCHLEKFYGYKASITNSEDANEPWRPSLFMPKEAARIWLKVTDINLERLQDITEDGAKAEGSNWKNGRNVGVEEKMKRTSIERFAEIWDGTIGKMNLYRYGWEANPWVWVIKFERCEKPEGWPNEQ
mgnify:CR=1 FL=1